MEKKDKIRFGFLLLVISAAFCALIIRLANLQVRGADDYGSIAESVMTKTIYERGQRGQILDVNGARLAFDKKIYNINFYRDPTSNREQNGRYSKAIWEIIQLVERAGGKVEFPFWLAQDENGAWRFDTGTESEGVAAAREKMFRSNFYVKSYAVDEIFERLCYNYMIHEVGDLPLERKLQILSVWQEMQMNAFNSVPITLASDVSWATAMEVETRLITLDGVSVSVENQRVYPKGTLACHILGYTGLMQSESTIQNYLSKGYQRNDKIGLDGVEYSMEEWLTPNSSLRQGYRIVEVDRSGKQVRELSREDPTDGYTVKLTIDSGLQAAAEAELASIINSIRDREEKLLSDPDWLEENKDELLSYEANEQKIQLAQNGAIVVLDMQCRVLAMASYPNYDPNLFVLGMTPEQRARMFDARNPLYNNAIAAADTPGSVFKMCTALAALANGALTVTERISDGGPFTRFDKVNPPRCWKAPHRISDHADQTIVEGLSNSCNYFFYTIAADLGADGELLYQYAAKLGLTSKTNIDLPGEKTSVVGSQTSLYDPTRAITGLDQDTWLPVQVKAAIKAHLNKIAEKYELSYSDERLDTCIKALMDMAVVTEQTAWVRSIRPILMEELGMSMELVWRAEVVSEIYLRLNEIKWGGSQTIMTAIGQSITLTTPVAMARYVAAVANGGYVYDVQIIDSILSPDGEVINDFSEPVVLNDLSQEIGEYLPYIKLGMQGVVDESGTAAAYFDKWKYIDDPGIAAKTGTAEKSKLDVESNAWFVSMSPYENPEIVVVVYVPRGYSGAWSSIAARNVIEYYLDTRVETVDVRLPAPNSLAP